MSNPSRRQFLGQSAALASAAALPLASRQIHAADSPNERLRVVVLGVHGRGGAHVNAYHELPNTEVAAIVDPDEAVGQNMADAIEKRTGKRPEVYLDMRKAYDDKNLHIASIATPNHWHTLAAIWAMQAGKDVYVEKPVSHNVSEGRRQTQAARKYDRICQFGAQCRTIAGTRDMVQFVLDGGIGNVKLARGLCYKRRKSIGPAGKYPVPENVDYNIWLGPAPKLNYVPRRQFHYDWHWQWPTGNGDLGNQGIHQMDVARWGLGWPDLGETVTAYGGRLGYDDAGNTANTEVSIHTRGDETLVFETRGLETEDLSPIPGKIPGSKIGVIFYGDKGYAVQYRYNKSTAFDLDGNEIKEFGGGSTLQHFANFVDAVREHDRSILNAEIEDGHLSSALCHLGNISYKVGEQASTDQIAAAMKTEESQATFKRTAAHLHENGVNLAKTPLTLGPTLTIKNEEFVGAHAEAANSHLTRDYREPFVVPTVENL